MLRTILILGGSAEAQALAGALAGRPGLKGITALAGRTAQPRRPAGALRIGGFGGAEGLADYLRAERIAAVVDATHPFAARMGWNAAQACAAAGVPLLRLERPAWLRQPGDVWDEVEDWAAAVDRLRTGARRVLLALGRQELAPFAALTEIWFLIRSVQAPEPWPPFAQAEFLPARGPFSVADERALLLEHGIDTLVCKNSGGPTGAKLEAARALGLRVVMRRRPPRPETARADGVDQALAWLERL